MNTSKLFIADKIKVGFNPRTNTYTGMLGYVIGHDGKKWRKEPSWEGWRYKYMPSDEYESKKRSDYNDRVANQTKQHETYVEKYRTNPLSNDYYNTYAKMSLQEYLSKFVGEYDGFKPNLHNISPDENVIPKEYDNVPTEGFVLNKKVGGYSSGWNHRSTYCRVYDPRGFEFEITIPNLLFILQECNAMKGKGLEGSFVYAWDGKDLVLLPTSCEEYIQSGNFTKMQSGKISTKDLVEGCTYKTKQMEDLIYLGKFNWFSGYGDNRKHVDKKYIFYKNNVFIDLTNLSSISKRVNDTPVSNYVELIDKFNSSDHSGVLMNIIFKDFHIQQKIRSYYSSSIPLEGTSLLPLGDDKYEVYTIIGHGERYSSYSERDIKYYEMKTSKVLSLNGKDFKLKSIPAKTLDNITYTDLKAKGLKTLTIEKNNKQIEIQF